MSKTKASQFKIYLYIGFPSQRARYVVSDFIRHQAQLIREKVYFLGKNLEHAPIKMFSWQDGSTHFPSLLNQAEHPQFKDELQSCLEKNIEYLNKVGAIKAIWFNEYLIDCGNMAIPIFRDIVSQNNMPLEILCGVDEPSKFLNFLYQSLGIIHKSNHGAVLAPKVFFNNNPANLLKKLNPFLIGFKKNIKVINTGGKYSKKSLFEILLAQLDVHIKPIETQDTSISIEQLYLRYIFNTNLKGAGPHDLFEEFFNFSDVDVPDIDSFVEHAINYSFKDEIRSIDQETLNIILDNNNQESLSFSDNRKMTVKINEKLLLKMLLAGVVNKAKSIQ